jgi:cytochrome c biogenesis protein CcdA
MIRFWGFLCIALITLSADSLGQTAPPSEAVIYYNDACHDCAQYLDHELIPLLRELGISKILKKDFINERSYRKELIDRSNELEVPPKLQGHLTAFVGEKLILQGHVPSAIVRDLLRTENLGQYQRIVVVQDKMSSHGDIPTHYQVWGYAGEVREYPIETPIQTYLTWLTAHPGSSSSSVSEEPAQEGFGFMMLVLGAGLIDGINPCAFAVLLLFMAFLFTLQRARSQILQAGLVYIAAIYLTYLAIGLGLLKVFSLSSEPHLMAKLGSGFMILLGLVNVKDYFWYGRGFSLSIPSIGAEARERWMRKATLPAVAVLGLLVGLCEFPCTGGIYVGILGLLAAQTSYWSGFGYLLAYNVMFVLPLVALLLIIGNRRVIGQISRWEVQHKRQLKLSQGLVMIALGIGIIAWFM